MKKQIKHNITNSKTFKPQCWLLNTSWKLWLLNVSLYLHTYNVIARIIRVTLQRVCVYVLTLY